MGWTKALHFKQWADTQEARHQLPLLIRKLVRAISPDATFVNFSAHEQVQRPGFDGFVEESTGNQFVPAGKSGWEMGVNAQVPTKYIVFFANS